MNLREKFPVKFDRIIYFGIAFVLMLWLLIPQTDMLLGGGDVTNIWQTITTFFSSKVTASYVLYKGIFSVYPYVWLYQLSLLFGVDSFFFIKLYHCFLFAYIAAIGLPYFISKFLHIEAKPWRRIALILILFFTWQFNNALRMMMIDLPSLTIFILCVNSALKISEKGIKASKLYLLYAGVVIGACLCFSGQYSVAAYCIVLFILLKMIPLIKLNERHARAASIMLIICFAVGIISVKAYNNYFEKSFVQPFRDAGEWIPTKSGLASYGITSSMSEYGLFTPKIHSNRGEAIMRATDGLNYDQLSQTRQLGGGPWYTPKQLVEMFLKHPIDFISCWCNRLFIGLSPDDGRGSILFLFLAYTSLFVALFVIKKRCKTVKQVFSLPFILILAFLFATLAACVWEIEMRYVMAIQSLIFSVAILDDTVWNGLKGFWQNIRQCIIDQNLKPFIDKQFPYIFVIYLVFVIACYTHFGTLMELKGADPSVILFTR